MKAILTVWRFFWSLVALPFAYAVVLCAIIAGGLKSARDWAHAANLPWKF